MRSGVENLKRDLAKKEKSLEQSMFSVWQSEGGKR
jgi:hypothetical protein